MKKILILSVFAILSCGSKDNDESNCMESWEVSEYCTRTPGCTVVACRETPSPPNVLRFKCSEVKDIKPGDVVLYKTVDCAKFYRKFIKKM